MDKGLRSFYNLVEAFENLPTIGRKSALRLAYHITMSDSHCGLKIAHAIENAIKNIQECKYCGSMSEHEVCEVCLDDARSGSIVAIVQNAKDIFVLEEAKRFSGKYFVLNEINEYLVEKLKSFLVFNKTKEVLFAITPSLSSDVAIIHIEDRLKDFGLKFSKIAQGVPTGVSLENVDMMSLARAIESRVDV